MLDLETLVIYNVEGTAAWRNEKLAKYPEDIRNLEAAHALERLASDLKRLEGSELHKRLAELLEQSECTVCFSEQLSQELRSIGFHSARPSGEEFLSQLIELAAA